METWIFGEEYNLMGDDVGLTDILSQVLEKQGIAVGLPVTTSGGGAGIVDLAFCRAKKHWGAATREYLVVELKRPTVTIGEEELAQCGRYARALVNHPKFAGTKTSWDFWAVSNKLDAAASDMANQKDRPEGLVFEDREGRYRIWAVEWGFLLREAESRHKFFQDQLNITAVSEDAVAYLRKTHQQLLPSVLAKDAALKV